MNEDKDYDEWKNKTCWRDCKHYLAVPLAEITEVERTAEGYALNPELRESVPFCNRNKDKRIKLIQLGYYCAEKELKE